MAVRKRRSTATKPGGIARWVGPDECREIRDQVDELETMGEIVEWVFAQKRRRDRISGISPPHVELAFRARISDSPPDALARAATQDVKDVLTAGTIISTARVRRTLAVSAYAREHGRDPKAAREYADRCPVCQRVKPAPRCKRFGIEVREHLYCADHLAEEDLEVQQLLAVEP